MPRDVLAVCVSLHESFITEFTSVLELPRVCGHVIVPATVGVKLRTTDVAHVFPFATRSFSDISCGTLGGSGPSGRHSVVSGLT